MLINKGYQAGDVVCFKLVGEEVVAKIVEETADGYVLSKPCTVVPSQQGIGLMQSLISADINTNITLNKSHVVMHSPVITDIENHYIRTTTGIQPVTKGGIIT
jgi:hypothetical protein